MQRRLLVLLSLNKLSPRAANPRSRWVAARRSAALVPAACRQAGTIRSCSSSDTDEREGEGEETRLAAASACANHVRSASLADRRYPIAR